MAKLSLSQREALNEAFSVCHWGHLCFPEWPQLPSDVLMGSVSPAEPPLLPRSWPASGLSLQNVVLFCFSEADLGWYF